MGPTWIDITLAFLWAFMVTVFAIPSIVRISHLKNLLDEPNFRTVHVSLTPRLGGLAIFAGFVSALTIFGDISGSIQKLLAGTILLFFIGVKDDIVAISPFKKFFIQVVSTCIIVFIGDIRITDFQGFLGIYRLEDGISYALTFLIITGVTNAINLIDGLDGLAGSMILINSVTFGIAFAVFGTGVYAAYACVAFSLAGAVLGFLRYNGTRAIIFMGDTGSLVSGFLIAVFAIQFVEMKTVSSAPALAVATMFVPVFDTIRVFACRILQGKSPFSPDKNHIHHILLRSGLTQLATVFVLGVVNISVIAVMALLANLGNNILLPVLFALGLLGTGILELIKKRSQKLIAK
jgi:UDP-N-acetylmuramyl pentapeptide phosphotransferase/UDP-N-acetylglucosamine-1-phosphate transferase